MKKLWLGAACGCVVLIAGCVTREPKKEFLPNAAIGVQGQGGGRDVVLFPDYFRMDGYQLNDHGRIPRTHLIGAGMTANLELAAVRTQFSDVLHSRNWTTDRMEIGRQSFRIMASHSGETVEIRAVQGSSGPTQIFLLYTPEAD